jgi:hypothetical protein
MALQQFSRVLIAHTYRRASMRNERFVAVGLLTQRDLDVLGSGFHRAFPLNHSADFAPLLKRIDEAVKLAQRAPPCLLS